MQSCENEAAGEDLNGVYPPSKLGLSFRLLIITWFHKFTSRQLNTSMLHHVLWRDVTLYIGTGEMCTSANENERRRAVYFMIYDKRQAFRMC